MFSSYSGWCQDLFFCYAVLQPVVLLRCFLCNCIRRTSTLDLSAKVRVSLTDFTQLDIMTLLTFGKVFETPSLLISNFRKIQSSSGHGETEQLCTQGNYHTLEFKFFFFSILGFLNCIIQDFENVMTFQLLFCCIKLLT